MHWGPQDPMLRDLFFNEENMSKIIGIDLGTTYSCVAFMEAGQPKVIPNAEGDRTTASVVAIREGQRLVGKLAKNQAIVNPKNTIFSAKRLIGRMFDEVQNETKNFPFEVKRGDKGEATIVLDGKPRQPAEISAMVLQKLKADAEAFLGEKVEKAVITCPAYFNDSQRNATKDAGKIAGLEVERIINEPTAAAFAYGLDKKGKELKVAVYDLGGGTFDVSIIEMGEGITKVLSTNGDTHLGGDDFDQTIMEWLVTTFKKDSGLDLHKDPMAMQRLKDAAEKAKIELSSSVETDINLPFITADASGPKHINVKLTRAKLEELVADLIERSVEPCEKAIKDSGLGKKEIDEVILVGGMTRMPAVQAKVKAIFVKEPSKAVNPDEAVAIGAAIQGGILRGDVKDILLLDVTPLTLSIETLGGIATPMIKRNTTIPTSHSQVFSTAADSQPAVEVHVSQGEREFAAENKSLGRFILDGIPPAPRGVPQVEVTFDIDANGILSVKAKDKGTGKEQHITIQGSSGLKKDEVEKMAKEAETHAGEDKKRREKIEARNHADSAIYQIEKSMRDLGDKLTEADKKPVEEKIEVLKKVLKDEKADTPEIEKATQELLTASQHIGEKIYRQQQADQSKSDATEAKKKGSDAAGDAGEAKGDVVDAKVVDDEDKKKKD